MDKQYIMNKTFISRTFIPYYGYVVQFKLKSRAHNHTITQILPRFQLRRVKNLIRLADFHKIFFSGN